MNSLQHEYSSSRLLITRKWSPLIMSISGRKKKVGTVSLPPGALSVVDAIFSKKVIHEVSSS